MLGVSTLKYEYTPDGKKKKNNNNIIAYEGSTPGTPVSSTNKTDRHDITEILLKVTLNTINNKPGIYTRDQVTDKLYHIML
jgi:hypothetical protein